MAAIRPIVLTIAATDSAGISGVSADIKVQNAFEVHTALAITATTAQTPTGGFSLNATSDSVLNSQLCAAESLSISAIKIGVVTSAQQMQLIVKHLPDAPIVWDPVLRSSLGADFISPRDISAFVQPLVNRVDLITPNFDEAEQITGLVIKSKQDMIAAGIALLDIGFKAVLLKGGHANNDTASDYYCSQERCFWLHSERQATANTRATGCNMSSAIASGLALGHRMEDAVVLAKMTVNQGLREGYSLSNEPPIGGPVNINRSPNNGKDLPSLTRQPIFESTEAFANTGPEPLGLYPIVERADWLERLLPLGITTAQLRCKDLQGDALEQEIYNAIQIANRYECRFFVNDHWQLAIKHKAYGVHLGQEDLDSADLSAINAAGLRLGVSSHCHYEVARATALKPSYIACGPVYETTTKIMPWQTHGVTGLDYWRNVLEHYPVVAIGGINAERLPDIASTGVSGVAMISAITHSKNPEDSTRHFMQILKGCSFQ